MEKSNKNVITYEKHKIGIVVNVLTSICIFSFLNEVPTTSNFLILNNTIPTIIYIILRKIILIIDLLILLSPSIPNTVILISS